MNLTDLQSDALREITNIGTGNAVSALGSITDSEVGMSTPSFGLVTRDGFEDILGSPEEMAVAVLIPLSGDLQGYVAFVLTEAGAFSLIDRLLAKPTGTTEGLGALEHSAVCEVGNIVAGAFLTALCEMTGLDTACEPPGLAWDMVGSILESLSCVVPSLGDLAVTIVTETHLGDVAVEGVFALIPELQSLDPLFSALGVANAAAA